MPLTPEQHDLLQRIEAFPLDDPSSPLTFTRRLARECRWPLDYALRAVREYKRFLFLAMEAGHPVTPSDQIDQAWHLHLLYTRSYWDDLCQNVLPRPLHHGPTKGGASEGTKFNDWYTKTLDSYRRLLDEPPPPDLWPAPAERFDPTTFGSRVRPCDAWLIPKLNWRKKRTGR
ncbi:MAG: hypothetical protein AAF750_16195 [Planctomycetota bacterium]